MLEYFKWKLIKIGWRLFKNSSGNGIFKKIKRRFYLSKLYREDWARFNVEIAKETGVKVGENCRFYSINFFSEPYLIEIGNDVIISGEVIFVTHDGGIYLIKDQIPDIRGYYGRIKIGNNCFIGMGAIILPNVEIGDNCIIGAGAVVAQSFGDNSVIMGNPAKVVFKTDMYVKMRKNSKYTVTHKEYPFPTRIPDGIKRKLLEQHFNDIPVKRPRIKKTN